MNKSLFTLLVFFLLGNVAITFAHALFIKTEKNGIKDQSHAITIFYAEAAEGKMENIKDWWSNTKEFSLWVTHPNGTKKQLKVKPNDDHFTATFIPEMDGIYHLAIYHDVAEIYDGTQYQFNASATVHIGAIDSTNAVTKMVDGLFMRNASLKNKVNSDLFFTVLDNGAPVAELPVTFYAPNGWTRTLHTNGEGKVSFTPLWEGNYFVETYTINNVENEANFNKKNRIVTTFLHVE